MDLFSMTESLKGIIFDFDGLILDTETPEMEAWERAFSENGLIFPSAMYLEGIGLVSDNHHVQDMILEMAGSSELAQKINREYQQFVTESQEMNQPRAGIMDLIDEAEKMGLRLGIASSSYRVWVESNLERLGLLSRFEPICTRDDVARSKPDPELYNLVLSRWDLKPQEAFVLEDSPNGIKAAKNAALFCVAVTNPITSRLDVSQADMIFSSFQDFTLQEILINLTK
jgi:HAD superfamily hydrolase (TIGR01509 family)